MKKFFRRSSLIIFVLSILKFSSLLAQSNTDSLFIKIIAQTSEDSIILRWAPLDFKMWDFGLKHGYKLQRFEMEVTENNQGQVQVQQKPTITLGENFKPIPQAEWEPLTKGNDYATVAAGAIFGERFTIKDISHTTTAQIYDASNEVKNRFSFGLFAADQSFEVAVACGLGFVDHSVEKGKNYVYVVTLTAEVPDYVIMPGIVEVKAETPEALPPPTSLAGEFSSKGVRLSWDMTASSLDYYTSFQIERSEDGGATFEKRNRLPYVFLESPQSSGKAYYVDTLEQVKVEYQYRILGKTPFGQFGPPSNIVTGQNLPPAITAHPFIHKITEFPKEVLQVKWRFDNSFNDKIKGFNVFRANKVDGHYEKINTHLLGVEERIFSDELPMPANYYVVAAIDENDYVINCVPQLGQPSDATPPAGPVGLSATVDTSGRITLSWQKNLERDLLGYRVFFANRRSGTFTQVTSTWVEDSLFYYTVNLKTLSEHVYFKIRALDFHENYSAFSEIFEVKLPDIVPPVAPVFERTEARTTGIYLRWRNSSSDDIASYKLHRKTEKAAKWTTLAEFTKDDPLFEYYDSTASYKYTYHYKILAIDDDQQMSNSKILTMKPIDTGLRTEILDFEQMVDRKNKYVQLSWNYIQDKNLLDFTIFRAKGDDPMTTYKIIPAADLLVGALDRNTAKYQYQDTKVAMNTAYKYAVMANFRAGAYSPLTESALIEY